MTQTATTENIKFLDSDLPDFTASAAAETVRRLYGIEGEFSPLQAVRFGSSRIVNTSGILGICARVCDP